MFLQQAWVGEKNTTHEPRKWPMVPPFVRNASSSGKAAHVGASWPERKTSYTAGSHLPAEAAK